MNRFARILVTAASIATGLAAVPSIASAQVVNVAPPAYSVPARPAPPAPVAQPASYAVDRGYGAPAYGHDSRDRWDDRRDRGDRDRDHDRDRFERARWEREQREHMRECEVAYDQGASPWTLAWMRCPVR